VRRDNDWGRIGDTREYLRRRLPELQDRLRATGAIPIDARQPLDQVVDAILSHSWLWPIQLRLLYLCAHRGDVSRRWPSHVVTGCPVLGSSAGWHAGRLTLVRRSAMTYPLGAQPGYRRTPLSAEEKARGEANFAPFVAQMLVASGRFRVSADTPDQAELFQGVARKVRDMLQRPVVSYGNGREIVITLGQEEASGIPAGTPHAQGSACSRVPGRPALGGFLQKYLMRDPTSLETGQLPAMHPPAGRHASGDRG
jgi:hypothetical protein